MSAVNYLHSSVEKHVEGDKRQTHEEFIIHGSKGFTAKYYHKDNKQEVRAILPKPNFGLLQQGGIKHSTTPVNYNGGMRISIQVFLEQGT